MHFRQISRVLATRQDIAIHRSLKRIGAQVEQFGQAQLYQRLGPDFETMSSLLEKHGLPLIVA